MQLASNWGQKNPEGRGAIQRNLSRLVEWTDTKFLKFNKDKGRVLHMGRKTPTTHAVWEPNGLEAALVKRTWGSWWTGRGKVHMSQQCALAPKKVKNTRFIFTGAEPGEGGK